MAHKYFKSLPTFTTVVDDQRIKPKEEKLREPDGQDRRNLPEEGKESKKHDEDKKPKKPMDVVKFENIDASAYAALVQENPVLRTSIIHVKNPSLNDAQKHVYYSLLALNAKGIWQYLKNIKPIEVVKSRLIFGYMRKRSKGAIKFFNNKWFFMISSRPLNMEDFLRDTEVLNEAVLPPLFEFDTMYQYYMAAPDDPSGHTSTLRTNDIISIKIKNQVDSREEGHSFILDTGNKKMHLNALYRFEMERWVEAIVISMQTARETKLSLTGTVKNISKLVT